MTVLCAMRAKGVTWVASDTRVTQGTYERVDALAPKFVEFKGGYLGVCGSGAFFSMVRDHASEIDVSWRAFDLTQWFNGLAEKAGAEPEGNAGRPRWFDASFIFATRGRLMSVCAQGGGFEHDDQHLVIKGSGGEYALGAAWLARKQGLPAQEVLITAIEAAAHWDSSCGLPVWLRSID